jgi:hypothetical protein
MIEVYRFVTGRTGFAAWKILSKEYEKGAFFF